uniref:2-dehydro-3-deoxygalactonokinase n=1 Tax=Candidatus Planktophila sp. TaxID=2175601 RepID=UPI00404A8277
HSDYLTEVLGRWRNQYQFMIAIGMIGSNIGLHETDFLPLPIDIDEVSNSLVKVPNFEPDLFIVPGVFKSGDVMRGEESQTLASGLENGLVISPGTHSKWVEIKTGQIIDFRTYLTGELFEILRNHSTLSKATESSAKLVASSNFLAGLSAESSDLTHDLFSIRANWLQGKTEDASREYLSGLLIGAEIKSAKSWRKASEARIVASDSLADIYIFALAHFGIKAIVEDNGKLINYFVALAKKVESKK